MVGTRIMGCARWIGAGRSQHRGVEHLYEREAYRERTIGPVGHVVGCAHDSPQSPVSAASFATHGELTEVTSKDGDDDVRFRRSQLATVPLVTTARMRQSARTDWAG